MNDLRVNNYAAFAGVTIPHQRLHITGAKLQHFFHSHNSLTTFFLPPLILPHRFILLQIYFRTIFTISLFTARASFASIFSVRCMIDLRL